MTIEEKIQVVKDNKSAALAALESVTDRIYDITDTLLNNKGNLMTAEIKSYKTQQFLINLRKDAKKYEDVRVKLMNDDFNLSLLEINYVALSFKFCSDNLKEQSELYLRSSKLSAELYQTLTEKSS